ncbi:MAG: HEPN domain-containing protein [Deltaproteobacteria bacterium]|nr:HEPN domain-containing protein [Deltaproteobacteria bacterium]MDZ4224461.1 HEPN domain-containing protein [bacterium]
MKNRGLAEDYILRAGHRMAAVELLMQRQSFADVVREAQEIVELCLKALLRKVGIEVPRIHDVSDILKEEVLKLPKEMQPMVDQMAAISKTMRRDRELSFYGTEDLTPSEFYEEADARKALDGAHQIYTFCKSAF